MDADGPLIEQPSSGFEPQRHRDHGGSPLLVVDFDKDPGFLPLRLCVRLEVPRAATRTAKREFLTKAVKFQV
jgi:hypothetical protein